MAIVRNRTSAEIAPPKPEGPEPSVYVPLPTEFPHDLAWRGPLEIYRDAVGPGTESADEFHYASAIATIGTLLGRHWHVRYPYAHYPNFFICLVGPTGASRKSAAMRLALEDLLMPLAQQRIPQNLFIAHGMGGTGEGLLTNIADIGRARGRSMLIYEDELAVTLRGLRREGTTLGAFLLQAADALPVISLSTRKRPLTSTSPTVCLLSASTSEWVEANVTEDDIRGGLVNRILWFYGTDKQEVPLPTPPPVDLLKKLYRSLMWIPTVPAVKSTAIEMDTEATEFYEGWYRQWRRTPTISPLVTSATARTHSQAVRLSLLYSVLDYQGKGPPVIDAEHIQAGVAVSEYCAAVAAHLFLTSSRHPDARTDRAMLETLRRSSPRPIGVSALHRISAPNVSAAHAKRLLDGLGAMGYVRIDRGFIHLAGGVG